MSVYTRVEETQLREFLQPLKVGELTGFQGIEGGVVNSNYFVSTTEGEFVLTLFEELEAKELPFFIELNQHLADRGLPCARASANQSGHSVFRLNGKPAALFTRLEGQHLTAVTPQQAFEIGRALGELHRHSGEFHQSHPSNRDLPWFESVVKQVSPKLSEEDAELLQSEWDHHQQNPLSELPGGIIHADLFRDNVLFKDGKLSGLLDFYFACEGIYLYDLAITANDWCGLPDGSMDKEREAALLEGYSSEKALTETELENWNTALRLAALRFWLSRLQESLFPAEGELVLIKDPNAFKRIIQHRRNGH